MRVLIPLYSYPTSKSWSDLFLSLKETKSKSVTVVINPDSGPGEFNQDYYDGMNDLIDKDVEILCYVATGFGKTNVSTVTFDIDLYESFYPSLCGGYFLDEGPGTIENVWKYIEYYEHIQYASGFDSIVVVNPGIYPDDSLYKINDRFSIENPGLGGQVIIVSFENKFQVFYNDIPSPPENTDRYSNSILVYDSFFSGEEQLLEFISFNLFCSNWGYLFFTDDGGSNPWDELPGYLSSLLEITEKVSSVGCPTPAPTPGHTLSHTPFPTPNQETSSSVKLVYTHSLIYISVSFILSFLI